MHVLTDFPFTLDPSTLMRQLHIEPGTEDADRLQVLVEQATAIARPKAGYRVAYITNRTGDSVDLDGTRFTSRMLSRNLAAAERVFAMIATCGHELDASGAPTQGDLVESFWWDAIKSRLHQAAVHALSQHLHRRFRLGKTASMQPGSGDAAVWPIDQQKALFNLMGDVELALGVRLTASCLMIPNKTTSGVLFPTEATFESCTVCRRKDCPSRRAPLDDALWAAIQHD